MLSSKMRTNGRLKRGTYIQNIVAHVSNPNPQGMDAGGTRIDLAIE